MAANEAYYVPNGESSSRLYIGDVAERGVVRGPGEIQATVAIENLIELVGCF